MHRAFWVALLTVALAIGARARADDLNQDIAGCTAASQTNLTPAQVITFCTGLIQRFSAENSPLLPQTYWTRALAEERNGDDASALGDLNAAISLAPAYSAALSDRGKMEFNSNDGVHALQDFTAAIQAAPRVVLYREQRGNLYLSVNRYQDAVADFTAALALENAYASDAAYFDGRSRAYGGLGEWSLALKDCNDAIRLDPKDAVAFNNRGFVYYHLKEYSLAIQNYDEAIRLDSDEATYYDNRAVAKQASGDSLGAKADFEEACTIDRDYCKNN